MCSRHSLTFSYFAVSVNWQLPLFIKLQLWYIDLYLKVSDKNPVKSNQNPFNPRKYFFFFQTILIWTLHHETVWCASCCIFCPFFMDYFFPQQGNFLHEISLILTFSSFECIFHHLLALVPLYSIFFMCQLYIKIQISDLDFFQIFNLTCNEWF